MNENENQSNLQMEQANVNNDVSKLNYYLKIYNSCFIDSILDEWPPPWGVDDHRIDLIQGISLPNKDPFCVSLAQQEEIMDQVNGLVEKGMIWPSISPFCSHILLMQKKDGSHHMCVD